MRGLRQCTGDIYGLTHVPRPDRDEPGVQLWLLDHTTPSIWNGVFVTHMRCRMTASLRATATSARRRPFVRTRCKPQVFSADGRVDLSSNEFATYTSVTRSRYTSGIIHLTRLEAPRGQPEMRPDKPG